jgi:TPR repeat protein
MIGELLIEFIGCFALYYPSLMNHEEVTMKLYPLMTSTLVIAALVNLTACSLVSMTPPQHPHAKAATVQHVTAETKHDPVKNAAPEIVLYQQGLTAQKAQKWKKAAQFYEQSAKLGYAKAQYALGYFYRVGQGVKQDYASAVGWFKKAAKQGNVPAQTSLGIRYLMGQGVDKDYQLALMWLNKAADMGSTYAANELGYMYSAGDGVPADGKKAYKWYRVAADKDLASAQYNLGLLYANGYGVPMNDKRALYWFKRALANGFHPAAAYINADPHVEPVK